ncbi:FAD-dependent monooxygenase [Microbacterium terregens]|uniref:FAD-dependent monooxygenase n=1 Tax=Microbacterium terregens TaxID=69363 RepID=A0ABV5SWL6_9MICO
MKTSYDYADVVVVGAGPAGLAVAAELAFHGRRCAVIEPRTKISHTRPRAKTTSVRTMEHFRRWGIAEDIRRAAALPSTWCRRAVFCDTVTGAVITEFDDIFGLSAAENGLSAESGQQIAQPVVEQVLRRHVRESGFADLRLGDAVEELVEHQDSVELVVRRFDGSTYRMRTRYVLGCDGARSTVREQIGVVLAGSSAPVPNLNVVFRAPDLHPPMGDALHYWVLGTETPGIVGPLDRKDLWWASLSGAGECDDPHQISRLVEQLIGPAGADVAVDVLATDPWTPRMLIADRFATDRIFLVGESAHVNPPLGGHGFNTSIGDAVNIGWKLAAVLDGWADPSLLATYETERRGIAAATIASAARNLAATGPALTSEADMIQATKFEEFHSLGLVLGYTYDTNHPIDVTAYRPSTQVGARLPHRWVRPGHSIFDDLGPSLSLLHPRDADAVLLAETTARFESCGVPLVMIVVDSDQVDTEAPFLLIRPDQHIAWRGNDPRDADPAIITSSKKRAAA